MKRSSRLPLVAFIGVVILSLIFGFLRYQSRILWKLDQTVTYWRGVFQPVTGVPTPADPIQAKSIVSAWMPPSPAPTTPSTPLAVLPPAPTRTPIPDRMELTAPGWEQQDLNNCGPATLAMLLRYYGWEGTQKEIADRLKPERGDRNVNVEELVYYVRTYAGWLNSEMRVGGSVTLLQELVASGFPVMIEKGFLGKESYWPDDDRWTGHYVLVTGYSQADDRFTIQDSFTGPDQPMGAGELDQNWKAFNRAMILVYPPDQEERLIGVLGNQWDGDQNRRSALQHARNESQANPDDVFAWFNLGTNLTYFEEYAQAVEAYDRARTLGWPQRMLRYQFGPFIAYFNTGKYDELQALTGYALERTPNSEEAHLWSGWAQYRLDDRQSARLHFEEAMNANPLYPDARYGLEYLDQNP